MRLLLNRGIVTIALAAAMVLGGAALASSAFLPSPEDLPVNTAAFVSNVPTATGYITRQELAHALTQTAAVAGRSTTPGPGDRGFGRLRKKAFAELLDIAWLEGQAAEMGIVVTPRQVAIERAQIKKSNFKSEREYHRFLKQSHFTRRDINLRVELQLLSTQIQERVVRGTRGKASVRALRKFVAAYVQRWKERTVCAPELTIGRCSNAG